MAADDYHVISKHGKTTVTSAVSPNSTKKPKERVPAKPDMPRVNQYLMCQLCSGYLIDATKISECLHTFCKSCILKYLETNTYCPICDVQLNERAPQESLRSDNCIQKLVYKLVPGLLVLESRRRRDFYIKAGMEPVAAAEMASNSLSQEIDATSDMSTVLSLDDVVSLSIEYFRSNGEDSASQNSSSAKGGESEGKQSSQSSQNQQKSNAKSSSVNKTPGNNNNAINTTVSSTDSNNDNDSNTSEQANDRRYLQCPAGVSVGLLKKFIRRKYGLSDEYRVDLLYNGNRDSILENDLTLLDVAFIYKWNKDDPMKLNYRIFERPTKSMTVYSGMKRPAPSVMDEPPDRDDDPASGPHSRSSMYSSSSAPSSKLPRLGDNTTNTSQSNQGSAHKGNTSGKSTTTSTETESVAPTSAPTAPLTAKTDCNKESSSSTPTIIKVEKSEVEEEDDDEDDEEDYELVERKEHMKGIKSSRKHSIRESMKRSVAASNLRSHISRSPSSQAHSTDSKNNVESGQESGNENSLNNSSSISSGSSRIVSLVKKRANSLEAKESPNPRGRPPKSVESLRLRVTSTDNNSSGEPQSSGSLKMSISTSGITPVVSSSPGGEKKQPLKLSLGSVLANKGCKSPDRKHHKHKHHHHHHHKLRHKDKQSKGTSSSSSSASGSPPENQKPIKISLCLSPPGTATVQQTQGIQSQQNSSTKSSGTIVSTIKSNQDSVVEAKEQKGKSLGGNQNYNNSARTSASAHGHLNNISKSISVSLNTNVNNSNNNSSYSANTTSNANKGSPHGNKILSPTELIPKNTGIEIQPTTFPIPSHGSSQNSHLQSSSSSSNASSNNNSHKHSHPLLPDSVHVPKSVTLIPVNPNAMSLSGSGNAKGNNNNGNSGVGGSSLEKGGSGSHQGSQNRINSHTFTHPITNKSLHQITVTEVPPPQKTNSGGTGLGNSVLGSNIVTSTTGTTAPHSSISGTTNNPIEKVIANAGNNKPQFNGPGSMEITKIYCGTATATSKENPAKKLKDRRGLDISITGMNVNINKSTQKIEETLRQKVNGGSGSISVTPVAPPNMLGTGSVGNNSAGSLNKIKSVATTAASLLSGKMPPGITIGPATIPQNPSNNNNNLGNNNNASINSNNSGAASASVGSNIMKGLGFTLPPHLTAHPHNPNLTKPISNQGKSDKLSLSNVPTNNRSLLGKDSVSIIGKGNIGGQQQLPPPVEITISATGGNKSQANITNRGINIVNKTKANDPLSAIFDIAQGMRKSPTLATNNAKDTVKIMNSIQTSDVMQGGGSSGSSSSSPMNTKNMVNKRPVDMSASGNNAAQNSSGNKKSAKEFSEMKKGRSSSTSSEPGTQKQTGKTGEGEIPLDLSGRSTRTTPPIIIPQIREPSKSPTVTSTTAAEKRVPSKSPETEKPRTASSPSSASNNFLSPKMNSQKNSSMDSHNKGQQSKFTSVSKLSPNQASKIGSIVDNLAQKQAQAQQQNSQNTKNSPSHQTNHTYQHSIKHSPNSNVNSIHVSSTPNSKANASNSHNSGNNIKNITSQSSSPTASGGITSPRSASSLTSPAIPMTSPSPPGDQAMRNLWTFPDNATRQGKMNDIFAAAGLFPPPGHHMAGSAAAQQFVAAAAAAAAASGNSPTGPNTFNPSMFSQFGPLAGLGANKFFDPQFMAAFANANAHAAAAGMRMHHPFTGSMSPPLNPYFPHGIPSGQQSPINNSSATPSNLQKGSGVASSNKTSSNTPGKPNSAPLAPLFSHSVPVPPSKSPNTINVAGHNQAKSPSTPSHNISNISSHQKSSFSSSGASTLSSSTKKTNHSDSSGHKDQRLSSVSGKNITTSHHSSLDSSTHGSSVKSTKINGIMSTPMPVFPPGIHNPLLPSRSNSNNGGGGNNTGNSSLSGNSSASTLNKTFPIPGASSSAMNKIPCKGGIPNSMKISNFLPNKPKDSSSDANAEATITSGFGIPPLQSKPNFSLSSCRSSSTETLSFNNSINIQKNPPLKEGSLSPVKSGGSIPSITCSNVSPTSKPRSLTCASLLLPDPMHSKLSAPHFLNASNPISKGDHGNLGLNRSNRTPSSDSILLSPNSSSSSSSHSQHNKSSSPTAAAPTFNKASNSSEESSNKPNRITLSPSKEMNVKKEKGIIPIGGSLSRNFTPPTTSSITDTAPKHTQGLNTLARPIPTIPAFFNRSSITSTNSPQSSNINQHHHHQHHQMHPHASVKDTLPHHHKAPSHVRKSTSPVKVSSEPQQHLHHQHPHHILPSPVFPFPGVSVPVQVKLQDDNNDAVPLPSAAVVTSSSIFNPVAHPPLTLKLEVNKLKEKEEKVEETRKRPCSSPIDHAVNTSPNKASNSPNLPGKQEKETNLENSVGIPPTKVQKLEENTPDIEARLEKQALENNTEEGRSIKCRESENQASPASKASTGGTLNESHNSPSQQDQDERNGEQQEEKGNSEIKANTYPSKDFCISPESSKNSAPKDETVSTMLPTGKVQSSPVHATVTPLQLLSEEQTQEKVEKLERESSVISVELEKSETQIVVDTVNQKSDEASSLHEESISLQIPEEPKNEEIMDNEHIEKEKEDVDDDIDVDVVNESEVELALGQSETVAETSKMDNESDNQVPVDSEKTDQLIDKPLVEERLTLSNEDEDIDVDIVDEDEAEQMDVSTDNTATVDKFGDDAQTMEEGTTVNIAEESIQKCSEENITVEPVFNESVLSLPTELEMETTDNCNDEHQSNSIGEDDAIGEESAAENKLEEALMMVEDVKSTESCEKVTKVSMENLETSSIPEDVSSEQVENCMEIAEPEKESEQNSIFLPLNESTNFSQDDSEYGDLVIDLDRNEEEMEKEENDNKVAADDVDISSSNQQEECNFVENREVVFVEETLSEVLSQETTLTKEVNEPSSTTPINSVSEAVEEQRDEKSELNEKEKPAALLDYDHESGLIESTEQLVQLSSPSESQNPDSILNQITINPTSNEVNGVIKIDMASEKQEEIKETIPVPIVSECPEILPDDAVHESKEMEEKLAECEHISSQTILPTEELNEQIEKEQLEENKCLDVEVAQSDIVTDSDVIAPSEEKHENENPSKADTVLFLLEKPEENDEPQIISEEEDKNSNEGIICDDEMFTMDTTTAPVSLPESDNRIEKTEIISVADDMMEQETTSSAVVVTGEEDQEETPMEIEEEEAGEMQDETTYEPALPAAVENIKEVESFTSCVASNLTTTAVDDVDEVSMQIETDIVLPTVDSSTCVPTNSNIIVLDVERAPSSTKISSKSKEENVNLDESSTDLELISATATITTEEIHDADESDDASLTTTSAVTPTTSATSSVAIKLNISTGNDEQNENDLNCGSVAESLLPSSNSATTSSTNLIVPSGNNTSVSSSSSSSPVDVSPTSPGFKSLESFGKVTAGFLASASSTINNNNNNSLAPTSCDAISIATTNANA